MAIGADELELLVIMAEDVSVGIDELELEATGATLLVAKVLS